MAEQGVEVTDVSIANITESEVEFVVTVENTDDLADYSVTIRSTVDNTFSFEAPDGFEDPIGRVNAGETVDVTIRYDHDFDSGAEVEVCSSVVEVGSPFEPGP